MRRLLAFSASLVLLLAGLLYPAQSARAATCTSSVGPGIPPPANVPSGIPGYHASWYGQSGYPTLCPGAKATSVVAYYNSGSAGWLRGVMGQAAYLGTWGPVPGQDQMSPLGGDGTNGSPNTGWPRYNRIAEQPAQWVGPNQVAWFTFQVQAPLTPGYYKLYLRPLIEGATWMEDYGVFWPVTVLQPDGMYPVPPAPAGCREWPSALGTMLAKLPLMPGICLRQFDQPLPGCEFLYGCTNPDIPAIWVRDQPGSTTTTAHETCQIHKAWMVQLVGIRSGYTSVWMTLPESLEFKAAYEQSYGPITTAFDWHENFAAFCVSWYYSGTLGISPALMSFGQKWLPK